MDCSTSGSSVLHYLPVCLNSCPFRYWYYLTISFSDAPFSSCLQPFQASGSFLMSQLFTWCGQSIGTSTLASVLPINIQGWFPLRLTGLIFFQSMGLSRVFSSTKIQKHQFFSTQPSCGSALISMHDYWKNYSFDHMNLCWQGDTSAF